MIRLLASLLVALVLGTAILPAEAEAAPPEGASVQLAQYRHHYYRRHHHHRHYRHHR